MERTKLIIVLLVMLTIFSLFFFDVNNYLTFESIKDSQKTFDSHYNNNPFFVITMFFLLYVFVTAISFPGAAVLTLLAGALFGVVMGTIIVSFASTLGATLAFILSRYIFQDSIEKKFPTIIKKINKGIKKEGNFYLFSLRLIPIFPFFVINLVMGLTKIKVWDYIWVSQLGMLLGTIVYVNAGTRLSELESLSGIIDPILLLSFVLLGIFPLLSKKLLELYRIKYIK